MTARAGLIAGVFAAALVAVFAAAMAAELGTAAPLVGAGTWVVSAGCVVVAGLSVAGTAGPVLRAVLAGAASFVLATAASAVMVALLPVAAFVPGFAIAAVLAPLPAAFVLSARGAALAPSSALAALVHVALMLGLERLQFGARASLIDGRGWLVALIPAGWALGAAIAFAVRRRTARDRAVRTARFAAIGGDRPPGRGPPDRGAPRAGRR